MATRRPPELMDELVEEVLLRLPSDDPELLLHAALVCKRWCRLVADRGFRRRYREFHRAPPFLGFICNIEGRNCSHTARFVPTSSFRPPRADLSGWRALRSGTGHGRVILVKTSWWPEKHRILVWDPLTDEQRELPALDWCPRLSPGRWNAAVTCASSAGGGCNHLDCRRGPFLVVFVEIRLKDVVAFVYSSEAGEWSQLITMQKSNNEFRLITGIHALVGSAFYFKFSRSTELLKFDLTTWEMSAIHLPDASSEQSIMLMATEDGSLGFATLFGSSLHLWSREVAPDTGARWVTSRIIDLGGLLPATVFSIDAVRKLIIIGVADGAGIIFMWTIVGIFAFDLKSGQVKNLGGSSDCYDTFVPFTSFCFPALRLAHAGKEFGAGSSSA